jgi:predicted secreted protein
MSFFNIALVFLIAWWIGWFLALPFGVKAPDKVEEGHASSAPEKPRLLFKAAIATVIGCVLTGIIVALVMSDWIDLRD